MADAGEKPRILVVEDHPLIAELVETRLRIEGMSPVTCPNGIEALDVLGKDPLDAVILDVMMPQIDGFEVLRRIRANPTTATLPVIMLTAKSTPTDIEKGLALGANYYITKPFSGLDLVRKLRTCLDGRVPAQRSERPPPPAQ
jgi:DNA-binding response OmpR family regulator